MSRSIQQATTLFDRLSADLKAVRPEHREYVLCPLCLRTFDRAALSERGPGGLSLEHIIPHALGGKWVTLSCTTCNNEQGSEFDAHFVRMIRALNWRAGDGSVLRGTVRVAETELPMKISWGANNDPCTIKIVGGKPETVQKFLSTAKQMGQGDEVKLEFSLDFIELRARKALVRIAYLALFEMFGYEYVLSGAGRFIRKLLAEGTIEEVRKLIPTLRNVDEEHIEPPIVISPIAKGDEIVAYLAFIRIDLNRRYHHAVLLPSPGIAEEAALDRMSDIGRHLNGKRHTIHLQ